MQLLLELKGVSITTGQKNILDNIQLEIFYGQQWAIIGSSGSGKTTLAKALTGTIYFRGEIIYHPLPGKTINPAFIEQQHHFRNLSNTSDFYYQQRFNSADSENSMTVADMLSNYPDTDELVELLHLKPLLSKPLIQLSNGENKRLQLARALIARPSLLILDNPFIGLDKEGRQTLQNILDAICATGMHILLITAPGMLPPAITHVAWLEKGKLVAAGEKGKTPAPSLKQKTTTDLSALETPVYPDFKIAVDLIDVNVRYGEKTILHHITWQVMKGQCWCVSGPNGAGKSTLLSLLTADNPQAYANKVVLFDRKRGSGESIWDIKKNIGYISPELHLHFDQVSTVFEVIASGLFDTVGLFRKLSAAQEKKALHWLHIMQIEELKNKPLRQISVGQQRMALLARALVKNPPLLILDEPCQGLDEQQVAKVKHLIDEIHTRFGATLIYVSHYDDEIPTCIDRFLHLDQGNMRITYK